MFVLQGFLFLAEFYAVVAQKSNFCPLNLLLLLWLLLVVLCNFLSFSLLMLLFFSFDLDFFVGD